MAIGARDYTDQLLVKKYAKENVDNHDNQASMTHPEKMMSAMNDYAAMSRNMFVLNQRLNSACSRLNARTARYTTRPIQVQQAAQFKNKIHIQNKKSRLWFNLDFLLYVVKNLTSCCIFLYNKQIKIFIFAQISTYFYINKCNKTC